MSKKPVHLTVLVIVLMGVLGASFNVHEVEVFDIQLVRLVEASTLTPHSPITIVGDSGFVPANGVTGGSGISEDPYIIEGWDINASQTNSILIFDTRAHFIIRNVFIHDGYIDGGHHGISFSNVSNGEVSGASITRNADGIYLSSSLNNVISGNNITANNGFGISLHGSSNTVSGNNITNNLNGILLYGSSNNNVISGNNIKENANGISLDSSSSNTISENNITFNEGNIYLGNSSDNTITGNTITDGAEAVQLYASSNNTISGNSISHNYNGIWSRYNSTENVISENNITANTNAGINLHYSHDNTISGNDVTNNWIGIDVSASSNNTLSGNNVTGNTVGLRAGSALINSVLVKSTNNTILENNVVNSTNGIDAVGVLFTIISRNHIAENNQYGITLDNASNNTISENNVVDNNLGIFYDGLCNNDTAYHNNFIGNTKHVEVSPGDLDAWDNGLEGNYWSNYNGVDLNNDGIGDSWYQLGENNTDRYPLMGHFHSFNTTLGKCVNVISNSTIGSFQHFEPNSTIIMHVSNMTASQAHGFCRVTIPHSLVSPPYNITVNGNLTSYTTVFENSTLSIIYFSYEHSTVEILIVPEFSSLLILPLLVIASLLASLVYRRKW